jgi:hypothetical protein
MKTTDDLRGRVFYGLRDGAMLVFDDSVGIGFNKSGSWERFEKQIKVEPMTD